MVNETSQLPGGWWLGFFAFYVLLFLRAYVLQPLDKPEPPLAVEACSMLVRFMFAGVGATFTVWALYAVGLIN